MTHAPASLRQPLPLASMLTDLLVAVWKRAVHLTLAYPSDPLLSGWLARKRLAQVSHQCLQYASLRMSMLWHEQQLIKPQHCMLFAPFQ